MTEFVWTDLWIQGGNILLGLLGMLLTRAAYWLGSKIKGDWDDKILARARLAALSAAQEIYQTYVQEIKKGKSDGQLTEIEKTNAKSLAIKSARSFLGFKGLGMLAKVLGLDFELLDTFLGSQVESAIGDLKLAGKTVDPT